MAIRSRTEARLLDAAEALFFTRGVAATPVDEILERSEVSSATMYRGYASKEALLAGALTRRHQHWIETWDAAVARRRDPRRRLLAVFDALADFSERPDGSRWCAVLGTAAEYADPPEELRAAVLRDTDAYRARLAELAEPLVGTGAEELAEELTVVITGWLGMRLRDPEAPLARARRMAEALLAARQAGRGGAASPDADF